MKVLLVEDDGLLCEILTQVFQANGLTVDVVSLGEEALSLIDQHPYDGIVLDVMLPTIDGWTVLQRLREEGHRTPVLLLTARGEVSDRVRGLELGADDYLPKPFDYEEFLARLLAIIRRGKGNKNSSPVSPPNRKNS